jgi:hypothetical protein
MTVSSVPEALDDLRQRYTAVLNTMERLLTEQQVIDVLDIDSIKAMELAAELMCNPALRQPRRVDFGAGRRLIEVVNRVMADDSGWTSL